MTIPGRSSVQRGAAAAAVVALTLSAGAGPIDPAERHLESHRLRAAAVYVGTVSAVQRLGDLEGLTGPTQGRMEATVHVAKALRAPAGAAGAPPEAVVKFDDRTPEEEGGGFYALAAGEAVLVFADGFEPAYPRDLLHGAPAALSAEVKALRDFVASMDDDTLRLHGLTAATRASEVALYDAALASIARLSPK